MYQLTKDPIEFPKLHCWGHLYRTSYLDGNLAIVAGHQCTIGKLSVNLDDELAGDLAENEFFVKLYGEGDYLNGPAWLTGLFEQAGKVFTTPTSLPGCFFRRWRLKT